jgi:hypothetical protein
MKGQCFQTRVKALFLFSPWKRRHRSAPTGNTVFSCLLFLFVFNSIPQDGCVHQHTPGSAHPARAKRKGHMLVWETLRARLGAVWGRGSTCLWVTTGHCRTDPCSSSHGFHCWEAKHSISERRVCEPRFNKPSAAPVQSPGNSLVQLAAKTVCAQDRESVQPLQSLTQPLPPR